MKKKTEGWVYYNTIKKYRKSGKSPTGIRLSVGDGIKREKYVAALPLFSLTVFIFLSGPHDLQSPKTNQHPTRARFKTPGPVHPGLSSHSVSWSGRCLLWNIHGGLSVGCLEPRYYVRSTFKLRGEVHHVPCCAVGLKSWHFPIEVFDCPGAACSPLNRVLLCTGTEYSIVHSVLYTSHQR